METDGAAYQAKRVILTAPPPHIARIQFSPELPYMKRALLARQPMGACIKVWIAYSRPFWRERGLNAFALSDDQPFGPVFDATPPGASAGILAGFFDAREAVQTAHLSAGERRALVVEMLVGHLGPEARSPIDYVEKDWTADPWSDGCYGAYLGPGVLTQKGPALRTPVGRIHWAGTETALVWTGYIEGALEAGERAAREVLSAEARLSQPV